MAAQDEQILKLTADRDKLKAELAAAVRDVQAAMSQMQQAARAPLSGAGQQSAGTLAAFGFSAEEASTFAQQQETANVLLGKTGQSVEELGEKAKLSKRDLNDLAGGLGLIHPQLGNLARAGINVKEALGVMFTPMGAAITTAAAALAAVLASLDVYIETIEEATEKARQFADQQERIRKAGVDVESSVSKELGKQGKGGEATFTAATSRAKSLRDAGFDAATADQVAAATTGAAGEDLASQEDAVLLAAAIESGAEGVKLGGKTDREQGRNLRRAMKYIDRNRERLAGSARAYTRPRQRQAEAAVAGRAEGQAVAQEMMGLSPEEAEARQRDYAELQRRGEGAVLGGFEDEGAWTGVMQDYNTAVKSATGMGESARMRRVREAREYGAAMQANQERRGIETSRMETILEQIAKNTAQPAKVNVNVGGRAPVPQTGSGPKRPTS